MEFLKENQVAFEEHWMLNMGQALSLPLIIIGMLIMVWSLKSSLANNKLNEQV
jgi:prolipoprotein diacylglyceryltransferase